ncbi:hypothetical protein [Chitinilyticum aquatile]|uniref:hypothetical protein n=1 Tax=Chitinilyticum aquatile TaxID=362520 RepID=UPI00041316C8|nr:hypothetical protein [Chitinilyticum aquatile]
MGSRSSNSTDQTVNNYDRRVAVQDGLGISGDGNSVDMSNNSTNTLTQTTTDHGAIAGAIDITKEALQSNSASLQAALDAAAKSQQSSYQFSTKIADNAFSAIGDAQHITATMGKNVIDAVMAANNKVTSATQEVNRLAVSEVANAWNNAKAAADGKSLGDFKYLIWAGAALVLLMVWKKG